MLRLVLFCTSLITLFSSSAAIFTSGSTSMTPSRLVSVRGTDASRQSQVRSSRVSGLRLGLAPEQNLAFPSPLWIATHEKIFATRVVRALLGFRARDLAVPVASSLEPQIKSDPRG